MTDEENQRRIIARHIRQLRKHLLPILDWLEQEVGPAAPDLAVADAIDAAIGAPSDEDAEPLTDRHYWVLSQLGLGVRLTKHDVMSHFGYSERTAKRILSTLCKRGIIEFSQVPRPGFYRLCDPDLLSDVDFAPVAEPPRVDAAAADPGGSAVPAQGGDDRSRPASPSNGIEMRDDRHRSPDTS